jgi:hypothetical protein
MIKTISESDIIEITRKDLGLRDVKNQKQGAIIELCGIKLLFKILPKRHFKEYLLSTIQNRIKTLKEGVEK